MDSDVVKFYNKKIKLMIQTHPNTGTLQFLWNWISSYILPLADVYLQLFSDDSSDLTKHLQDKMDIVQWVSREKPFLRKKQSLYKEQRSSWSFLSFPPSSPGLDWWKNRPLPAYCHVPGWSNTEGGEVTHTASQKAFSHKQGYTLWKDWI